MKIISYIIIASLCSFTTATFAEPDAPNDAQIAAIVITANNVDIDAGKLAERTSQNPEVKEFAKHMVEAHTASNQQAAALVKKLNVTPESSETDKSLKKSGKENLKNLKALKGKEFDKAYIDKEVETHQAVLNTTEKILIPNAKNPELNDMLVKALPLFEAHLEHAKQLQASLNKNSSGNK